MPTGGSDATLKTEVLPLQNTLEKVLSLRPVTWYWKAEAQTKNLKYGFIAQEVEEVLPDLISEEAWQGDDTVKGDGTLKKHIAINKMTPYLVGAVQHQNAQITQLLNTLRQQQDKIQHLTSTVEKLERNKKS